MPNNDPRQVDHLRSRIAPAVFGGMVVMLLLTAALWKSRTQPPPPAAPVAAPVIAQASGSILPRPPLGHREIVEAARLAAAAYAAAATPDLAASHVLVDRRFAVRIPFGCDGPQVNPGPAQAYFEVDQVRGTTKLVARSGNWTALPAVLSPTGQKEVEEVEGFWLPRPWSATEACPPGRDLPAAPSPVAPPSLGLAQAFEAGGSRLLRRDGRAYEIIRKTVPTQVPVFKSSYRLVLEGRIVGFSDGQAIRCWSETPEHQPVCVYGVEFDRIAFEDASRAVLSEWRN